MHLSKRILCHVQEGAIYKHFISKYRAKPTRDALVKNIVIAATTTDETCLRFMETWILEKEKPSIITTNEIKILPSAQMQVMQHSDAG